MEYFKKLYAQLCAERGSRQSTGGKEDLCENYKYSEKDDELGYWTNNYNIFNLRLFDQPEIDMAIGIVRIVLSIPVLFLVYRFFRYQVWTLASIKH